MSNIEKVNAIPGIPAIEAALVGGDLAKLSPEQRVSYYNAVCKSLGLNPLTKPFAYITLNGKLTLYALKDCTEQLRNLYSISIRITSCQVVEGVYIVNAQATRPDGRCDEATGAVAIDGAKGESRANAMMKAETKAKRRATLSICGLGMLDESEIETIPPEATKLEPLDEAQPNPQEPPRLDGFKQMVAAFGEIKKRIGEAAYYDILREFGVEHANDFKTVARGREAYAEMKKRETA